MIFNILKNKSFLFNFRSQIYFFIVEELQP